ncbi:hypothetical protein [Chroococcidiopsis sp.]|uniref:hypothetical protein n=1 Tax=Chroococcidiopsis sp. TaxID=3088168 RepID=UPI003F2F1B41
MGINWDTVRQDFILGKRKQLEDGSWVSEDYTHQELAGKYAIKLSTLRKQLYNGSWHNYRKAYLARVSQMSIGLELGLYTQENYQSEIAAMRACDKLGNVMTAYIQHRFGEVLDAQSDLLTDGELPSNVAETMNEVHPKTGVPLFLGEVEKAIKVTKDIYDLQRRIYENAPSTGADIVEEVTSKPKFANDRERESKISNLEAQIGRKLRQIEQESEGRN